MTKPDVTASGTGRTVARARSLLAAENPVPGDAFGGSWDEPRWQAELEQILASPRPRPQDSAARESGRGSARLRRPRRRLRLVGVSAIGVAAAVTAVVVFAAAGPQQATAPPGPEPAVFRWPGAVPGANPGAAGAARSVLLAVASTVANRPAAATGSYWRTDTEYGNFKQAGSPLGGRYIIVERGRVSGWDPRSNSGQSSEVVQWLGVQLAAPSDAAAWRRAGSPTTWNAPPDASSADPEGFADGNDPPTHAAPGRPALEFTGSGSSLSYDGKPLSALPADPALLRKVLGQDYQLEHDGGGLSAWLFYNAEGLLTDPVTPAVRSAVFRILASLPGAVSLGTVRDVNGQTGTGIALASRYPRCLENTGLANETAANLPTAPCTVQQRLIINPSTGLPLAFELRYVSPPGGQHWPVPGGLFSYQTFQGSGWTNQAPPKS